MAHKLDFQKGYAAMYSLNETPWHGLGNILDKQPNSIKELLQVSGLDFEVEKLPNTHIIGETQIISDDSFFTYRKDTNYILGNKLGKQYTVCQNDMAFILIDEMLQTGKVLVETAGSLDNGRVTFVCLKLTNRLKITENDLVDNYFCIFNSHDGSLAITTLSTPIRVVCNNTLQASLQNCKQKVSIKHTTNHQVAMKQALTILGVIEQNGNVLEQGFQRMNEIQWTQDRFFDYIASVYCTKEEIKDMSIGKHPLEALSTRKANIMKDTLAFAEVGVGQNVAKHLSPWWAYNAVTGAVANKSYPDQEGRFQSMIFGAGASTMERALTLASDSSKINRVYNLN